jgi:hypothetical protein
MPEAIHKHLEQGKAELQAFAITFTQLIAGLAVDPHGGFEKQYTARIERSDSEREIREVLAQLVQWAIGQAVTDSQREQLDRQLVDRGMPKVDDLRAHLLS